MTTIKGFIHGKFPRSAELVETSRNVDRKRQTVSDLNKQYKKDLNNYLRAQKATGLDYFEDGQLPWQDIFRPIVEACKGIAVGQLARWFDNNCFYRQPIITEKIYLDLKKLEKYFTKITSGEKWKVTLPSPFLFAKLAQDDTTKNFEETLKNTTNLIEKIISFLDQKGVQIIQLNEPYIPYSGADEKELVLFQKSIEQLCQQKKNAKLAVHFYFGNAKNVLNVLKKKKIADIVGIDFYKTNLADIPVKFEYDIIAGVLDGRNSLLENQSALKKFIGQLVRKTGAETIYVANSSDLELLPEPVAKDKMKLLGKLLRQFE